MPIDDRRQADLVIALGAVRSRIATACADSGRDTRTVTLIAVTKTRPVADILDLASLGVLDIGESKDQEARRKLAELEQRLPGIRWHLVGRLQTNKARSVTSYATAVHSVDRMKLVRALGDAADETRDTPLDVFVQLSLDDDPDRGGASVGELLPLAAAAVERPKLRLRGVMAVPPMGVDRSDAFARLGDLSATLRAEYPHADAISAGMSDDFDEAIRHGSTHVRVGTALLGRRDPTFG